MNYSICQDCGCKTSRLIFCGECSNREKRLAEQIKAIDKTVVKVVKPKVKKVKVNCIVTFEKLHEFGDIYFIKELVGGDLKIGKKVMCEFTPFKSTSISLDGISLSYAAFISLVQAGNISEYFFND